MYNSEDSLPATLRTLQSIAEKAVARHGADWAEVQRDIRARLKDLPQAEVRRIDEAMMLTDPSKFPSRSLD